MLICSRRLCNLMVRISTPSSRSRPCCRIVKAQDQAQQGRLANTAGADDRHPLARIDREAQMRKHRAIWAIGKPYVTKFDGTAEPA